MKNSVAKLMMLVLLLAFVAVGQAWAADAEDGQDVEVTRPVADDSAPVAHAPNPAFLPGADAGGAGGGEVQRSGKPQSIRMEDHICCPHGSGCDCIYYAGFECNLFGCASGGC